MERNSNVQSKVLRRGGYVLKRNAKGETELHVAIIRKQENRVESLIAKGHPVNVTDNGGWYPLHEACNFGLVKIVERLLETKGINLDAEGGADKVTPMMDAAENGYYDIVEMLLNRGASLTKVDRRNRTILDYLRNRAERNVDEPLNEERHRLQLIKFIEAEWKKRNFIPPAKHIATSDKNLKRSDLLKQRKRQKIETMKRCLGNDAVDDDEPSTDILNAKTYHKTIAAVGKSAAQRPITSSYGSIDDNDKPSLIPEEDFEVQEDWLDDDLNLFNKRKRHTPRIKRSLSFSSSDDADDPSVGSDSDMFDDFNEPSTSDFQTGVGSTNVEPVSDLYDEETEEKNDDDVELVNSYKRSAFADRQKKRKLRQTKLILPITANRQAGIDSPPTVVEHDYLPRRLSKTEIIPKNVPSTPLIVPKTTKVVVKIEGKKFLVPILDSDLDKNIGWLANQAAIRFSSNHGRKPLLRLFNADSVEIGVNDGVNLFLDEELIAEVINWDLLPLHVKYEEVCKNFNGIMYTNLKSALRMANNTNELNLENSGCKGTSATHLMKTVQDSYGLISINLRGNRLTVDNVKDLGVALVLLKSLKKLSLRNTGLSNEHLVGLMDGVYSTGDRKIVALQNLDLSYNLFDDSSKDSLEKLSRAAPCLVEVSLINCTYATSIDIAGLSIVK